MKKVPGSLRGKNVTPLYPGNFAGTVWIPKEFFIKGESPKETLLRYLDHLDNSEDILKTPEKNA